MRKLFSQVRKDGKSSGRAERVKTIKRTSLKGKQASGRCGCNAIDAVHKMLTSQAIAKNIHGEKMPRSEEC